MTTETTGWHLEPDLLTAYADGAALPETTVWSLEAHLVDCRACRAAFVPAAAPTTTGALVTQVRAEVLAGLTPPTLPRTVGSRWRRLRLVAASTASAPLVTVLTATLALVLAVLPGSVAHDLADLYLLLAAPLLLVAGLVCCHGPLFDPAHQVVASTPGGGLPLLLSRALLVLGAQAPLLLVADLLSGRPVTSVPGLWLLPAAALTTLTLALATLLPTGWAVTATAGCWTAVVALPTLLETARANARDLPVPEPVLLSPSAQLLWVAVALVAAAMLHLRRGLAPTSAREY